MKSCEVCGRQPAKSGEVANRITEWLPAFGTGWTVMYRCKDNAECRARFEAMGEPWPIRDAYQAVRT